MELPTTTLPRPAPRGTSQRGHQIYSGPEAGAWRKAHGIDAEVVARSLKVTTDWIKVIEAGHRVMTEGTALPYFDAVERAVQRRDRMVKRGLALLARLEQKP